MSRPRSTNAINAVRKHQTRPRAASQLWLGAITLGVFVFFCLFISRSAPHAPSPIVAGSSQSEPPAATQTRAAYGQLPLSFEANHGQANKSVNFLARGAGYTLALSPTEAAFALTRRSDERSQSGEPSLSHSDNSEAAIRARRDAGTSDALGSEPPTVLRMNLVGANRGAGSEGLNELEGKVNYLIGNDRSQWRTNISTFARVRYTEVYPGIDLVYYGNQKQLEYDFVVSPGRDAREIALEFAGAEKVEVEAATGDLLLTVREATIRQPKPTVYQEVAGARREVEGGYVLDEGGRVRFALGDYDPRMPLVIDPVLVYSTYLGGSGDEQARDITVDSSGNAYMCGHTNSTNFPTANAFDATFNTGNIASDRDAFVTKLNAAGTALVYSTYLGGTGNSINLPGDDLCYKLAVDSGGNAYVTGQTRSTNFPTANALQSTYGGGLSEGFLTKLNAAGNALVYSTYIGGDTFDEARDVALDSSGNAYVAGRTTSSNFATVNPIQATFAGGGSDVFVMKLNAAGSAIIYSTYLGGGGGTGNNGFDAAFSIALDPSNNVYITGQTISMNYPTANAIQSTFGGGLDGDAFVTKINAAGNALVYSTYLGGSDSDIGADIAVDSSGNAHVTGQTRSTNFPTGNALKATLSGTGDAFVTKLNAAGSAFAYSTYLGGSGDDAGNDIALDSSGNTYIAGGTGSTDLPTLNPTQGTFGGGAGDAFVMRLNPAATALLFSTYLGGTDFDRGNAIALDSAANIYVAGLTRSTNFPTLNPAQAANGGGDDAFVTKITDTPTPTTVQFNSSTTTNVQEDCTSIPLTITRSGPTTGTTVVDYATVDGTAKQKSDYTIALGHLTFAPSETSKTIILLISEDSLVEGNETFTVSLSNPTGGSLGTPSTATIQITDDATEPATNAIDDPAVFVCQQYHDLLVREPEPAGMQFYLNILSGCQSTDTECIKYTRGAISANFFRSPEFMQKGSFVMYLYMITLGQRPATAAGLGDSTKNDRPHYTEFMADLQAISDPNDDKAIVSARKDALTIAWLQRPEIQTIFGGLTNEQFVKKLESTAGVTLANESTLIANLNTSTQTRAQVLRAVAESPEVKAKLNKQAFMTMEYFGFLRREPEDCHDSQNWGGSDSNQCGYIFHNNRYKQLEALITPDLTENFIVRGFIESPEYRQRFGP
ncbi:MAG: hypothetical protein QOH25_2782 [Acidobacteriota bacterium]|jgi:hypothetical protein|nr:hypothetical protein [Acidobacteriota bacterium]